MNQSINKWAIKATGMLLVLTLVFLPLTASSTDIDKLQSSYQTIAAGESHSLALAQDGNVWAWGSNHHGQLGDLTTIDRHAPVLAKGIENVISLAAANGVSIALRADGTVWSWGYNGTGMLGAGRTTNHSVSPVQVVTLDTQYNPQPLTDIIAISAMGSSGMALRSDGTVWTWGGNSYGDLGIGERYYNRNNPSLNWWRVSAVQVVDLHGVVGISAGTNYKLALKYDGTVWAWGDNRVGQLGRHPSVEWVTLPVKIEGLSNITQVAAGGGHSLALDREGHLWVWGSFFWGALGTGEVGDIASPEITTFRPIPIKLALQDIVEIRTGKNNSMAITSNGSLYTWGSGSGVGIGQQTKPTLNNDLLAVAMVDSEHQHSLALTKDGVLWSWGSNTGGQIGVSGIANWAFQPVQVTGENGVGTLNGVRGPTVVDVNLQKIIEYSNTTGKPSKWAEQEIESAKVYGIITTKVLSNYQTPITREEFCELAVKLYEAITDRQADPAPASTFRDTNNPEILKAYQLGIVNGVGEGVFAPNNLVTREQIAVMFHRTMLRGNPNMPALSATPPTYSDINQVGSWSREAVTDMSARGIITGMGDGSFAPQGNATREQGIALVKRVYEAIN